MLKSRLSVARSLSICLCFGLIATLGIFGGFLGCQGPDTFLRNPLNGGAGGGTSFGSGGTSFGSGGHVGAGGSLGSGGTTGSGGSGGSGRLRHGRCCGGKGGRTGAGGSAMGGTTGSAGVTGSGGARDAGADMIVTEPAVRVVDANRDSEGGIVSNGMGPCMGLCAPAIEFVSGNRTSHLQWHSANNLPGDSVGLLRDHLRPAGRRLQQLHGSNGFCQWVHTGKHLAIAATRRRAGRLLYPGQRGPAAGFWRGRLRELLHVLPLASAALAIPI